MKPKMTMLLAGALFSAQFANGADIPVSSDITRNTKWTKNNVYILDKSIFVKDGATLTIEPGTLILGTANVANDTRGSLIITRDGKIDAVGTQEEPIVFTAKEERDGVALDPAKGDGGYWGGVVILGNAPINFYTGPATNANENEIEGFPAGSTLDIRYGGRDSRSSSGRLKYVSIRFGGYEFAPNREINGLTLGGVGSGTEIENIEIISNTDDGIEFFGGTVNTKRIAVAFAQDDSFDIDEGHRGFHQFWFSIQNADGVIGDRGGEWDGGNGINKAAAPFTNTRIFNATILGNGVKSSASATNDGLFLDDNFAGQVHNSVIHDFNGAMVVNSGDGIGSPKPLFQNTTFGLFGGGAGDLDLVAGTGVTRNVDPLLRGISRIPNKGLDPRPATNSPLLTGTRSPFPGDAPAGFFEPVNYRGAFGDTNWLDGWSYLSKKGYLKSGDTTTPAGPQFNLQPKSAVVNANAKVVLRARATATPAPTYQWFRNGKAIKGATSATLTINKFTAKNAGRYVVRATSGKLTKNSAVAILRSAAISSGLKTANAKLKGRFREQVRTNFKANQFSAKGLPKGLTISKSGLISGTPTQKGTFRVTITAVRKSGAKTTFRVVGRKVIRVS